MHQTSAPEVVIVELVTRATVLATGHEFAGRSIQVFRIREGRIFLLRDYFNPGGLAEVLGS